jgi:hypothetical protein
MKLLDFFSSSNYLLTYELSTGFKSKTFFKTTASASKLLAAGIGAGKRCAVAQAIAIDKTI